MKIKCYRHLVAVSVTLFAAHCLQAQSLWLHKPLYGNSGFRDVFLISAADTNEFILSPRGFNPLSTEDYGQTWNAAFQQQPKLRYAITGQVHPTPDLIILACNDQYDEFYHKEGKPEYDVGHILRSTDGGLTWKDTALGMRDTSITEFQARLRITSPIGAIEALDSNHIFVATMTTHYLHSSNGGLTWDSIPSPVTEHWGGHYRIRNSAVNPVAAYTAPNTLIVAEIDSAYPFANWVHKIYRTTDLGNSWNEGVQMTTPITDFAFTSPLTGFAAGYVLDYDSFNSTVIINKTTDGGLTWGTVYSNRFPFTIQLNGIAFTDSLYGLAAGDGGLVLRTTDGGTTWVPMTTDIAIGDSLLVLGTIAYPSRTRAMIASTTGVFIYQQEPLLDMPNITYPKYGEIAPKNVTITWDPVAGAARYHVVLIVANTKKTVVDTIVENTYFMFHDSITNQYNFYVTALNDTKTSNAAHRIIRFIIPATAEWAPGVNEYLYLGFAPLTDGQTMRITAYGLYSVHDKESYDLRLYDILGREQLNLSDKLRGRQEPFVGVDVPFTSLRSGVYVAVLRTSNGSASGKMVVPR